MQIAIVGSGYLGLVTGASFAHLGHHVVCVDNQFAKMEKLKAGVMPIYEPGLDVMVKTNVAEGRLRFSTDIAEATASSEVIFICVGTPPKPNGDADLSAFEHVAREMAPAMNGYKPILVTDLNSAELIKHASNAFLSMKISFINVVAQVCERTGADINKVTKDVGFDKRVGEQFLKADVGYDVELLRAVENINQRQGHHLADKVSRAMGNDLAGKTIGVLGLAFKPDDMRGAPSADIIRLFTEVGARVKVYDPVAHETAREVLSDVEFVENPYVVAEGADCVVLLTEWGEFNFLNLPYMKTLMTRPLLVDGRNVFEPHMMASLGFDYHSIRIPERSSAAKSVAPGAPGATYQ